MQSSSQTSSSSTVPPATTTDPPPSSTKYISSFLSVDFPSFSSPTFLPSSWLHSKLLPLPPTTLSSPSSLSPLLSSLSHSLNTLNVSIDTQLDHLLSSLLLSFPLLSHESDTFRSESQITANLISENIFLLSEIEKKNQREITQNDKLSEVIKKQISVQNLIGITEEIQEFYEGKMKFQNFIVKFSRNNQKDIKDNKENKEKDESSTSPSTSYSDSLSSSPSSFPLSFHSLPLDFVSLTSHLSSLSTIPQHSQREQDVLWIEKKITPICLSICNDFLSKTSQDISHSTLVDISSICHFVDLNGKFDLIQKAYGNSRTKIIKNILMNNNNSTIVGNPNPNPSVPSSLLSSLPISLNNLLIFISKEEKTWNSISLEWKNSIQNVKQKKKEMENRREKVEGKSLKRENEGGRDTLEEDAKIISEALQNKSNSTITDNSLSSQSSDLSISSSSTSFPSSSSSLSPPPSVPTESFKSTLLDIIRTELSTYFPHQINKYFESLNFVPSSSSSSSHDLLTPSMSLQEILLRFLLTLPTVISSISSSPSLIPPIVSHFNSIVYHMFQKQIKGNISNYIKRYAQHMINSKGINKVEDIEIFITRVQIPSSSVSSSPSPSPSPSIPLSPLESLLIDSFHRFHRLTSLCYPKLFLTVCEEIIAIFLLKVREIVGKCKGKVDNNMVIQVMGSEGKGMNGGESNGSGTKKKKKQGGQEDGISLTEDDLLDDNDNEKGSSSSSSSPSSSSSFDSLLSINFRLLQVFHSLCHHIKTEIPMRMTSLIRREFTKLMEMTNENSENNMNNIPSVNLNINENVEKKIALLTFGRVRRPHHDENGEGDSNVDVEAQREIQEMMTLITEHPNTPLPLITSSTLTTLSSLLSSVRTTIHTTLFNPFPLFLSSSHYFTLHSSKWNNIQHSHYDSSAISLPSFSVSPSDVIQSVVDGMMKILQILQNQETMGRMEKEREKEKESLKNKNINNGEEEGEGEMKKKDENGYEDNLEISPLTTFSSHHDSDVNYWLTSLCSSLLSHFTDEYLSIPALNSFGSIQLLSDIERLRVVVDTLCASMENHKISTFYQWIKWSENEEIFRQKYTEIKRDNMKENSKGNGNGSEEMKMAKKIAKMRKINVE